MMASLPSPLTPPGCDLRAFDWFPFFHKRLLKSSFWSRASDQACRISVDFWSIAYEQVPAASLPDDDYLLAEWAGFGRRNIETWRAVKSEVMEPWVMCSDGRWYHPTLSEVACKAWVERRVHLWKRECDRIRKENVQRVKKELDPLEFPQKPPDDPFADADDACPSKGTAVTSNGGTGLSGGKCEDSKGNHALSDGTPPESWPSNGKSEMVDGFPAENSLKGRGRGTGRIRSSSLRSEDARAARDAFDREFWPRYPHKVGKPAALKSWEKLWRETGGVMAPVLTGLERYCRDKPADRPWLNPATFLNQRRFEDQPATSTSVASSASTSSTPRIDFGGGVLWPEPSVVAAVGRWRDDPSTWPGDRIGPPPGMPGCRVPERLLEAA